MGSILYFLVRLDLHLLCFCHNGCASFGANGIEERDSGYRGWTDELIGFLAWNWEKEVIEGWKLSVWE